VDHSTYPINKGINKSIVFRGLKAQYIWCMGGAMFVLLILYAIMYVCKVNTFACLAITASLGAASMVFIYHLSATYGEHGLTKAIASRSIPKLVKSNSRRVFKMKGTGSLT